MLAQDIQEKIEQIQLITRRTLYGTYTGNVNARVRGTGFIFDQLREYQQGDDIRFIDWNSSLRSNALLVKSYFQERDRTIFIVLDCSASMMCGSARYSKHYVATCVAAALACAAHHTNDRVALCTTGPESPQYVPPVAAGHTVSLMEQILSLTPATYGCSVANALEQVLAHLKKGSVVFVISDFIEHSSYLSLLGAMAHRHEVIAVRCLDQLEHAFNTSYYLHLTDPEKGESFYARPSCYNELLDARIAQQTQEFQDMAVDILDVMPQRSFIDDVIHFFGKRMRGA